MQPNEIEKRTPAQIQAMKQQSQKITMLTAYDYPTAGILSRAGIDMILVGDSLAMVVLGHESTRGATMEDMVRHTEAVARGNTTCLVVGDMPYQSYDTPEQALTNGRRLVDAGADVVKLEGNYQEAVRRLIAHGIPVMGHVGLTPQHAEKFRVEGRKSKAAKQMIQDALELQDAGCFSMVIESVPRSLGAEITQQLAIPTIGIGAGPDCNGQVLVWHDMVGLFDRFTPRFVKRYAEAAKLMEAAVATYRDEVRQGVFPADEHCYD